MKDIFAIIGFLAVLLAIWIWGYMKGYIDGVKKLKDYEHRGSKKTN